MCQPNQAAPDHHVFGWRVTGASKEATEPRELVQTRLKGRGCWSFIFPTISGKSVQGDRNARRIFRTMSPTTNDLTIFPSITVFVQTDAFLPRQLRQYNERTSLPILR